MIWIDEIVEMTTTWVTDEAVDADVFIRAIRVIRGLRFWLEFGAMRTRS